MPVIVKITVRPECPDCGSEILFSEILFKESMVDCGWCSTDGQGYCWEKRYDKGPESFLPMNDARNCLKEAAKRAGISFALTVICDGTMRRIFMYSRPSLNSHQTFQQK